MKRSRKLTKNVFKRSSSKGLITCSSVVRGWILLEQLVHSSSQLRSDMETNTKCCWRKWVQLAVKLGHVSALWMEIGLEFHLWIVNICFFSATSTIWQIKKLGTTCVEHVRCRHSGKITDIANFVPALPNGVLIQKVPTKETVFAIGNKTSQQSRAAQWVRRFGWSQNLRRMGGFWKGMCKWKRYRWGFCQWLASAAPSYTLQSTLSGIYQQPGMFKCFHGG